MNRYISLYSLPAELSVENAPLRILSGELLLDRFKENVCASLTLQSISDKRILSVRVRLIPYDAKGIAYPQTVEYFYDSLKLERDEIFAENKRIPMPDGQVRSFTAYLSEVVFFDYSTWKNTKTFGAVLPQQGVAEVYGEGAARKFTARYGEDCRYLPKEEDGFWYCACGAVNRETEARCHSCRRNRNAFRKVNFEALKREAEEEAEQNSEAPPKKTKRKLRTGILATILILFMIGVVVALTLSAAVPLQKRHEAYTAAETLLKAGKYEEAKAAFEELGDYLDAETRAKKDVPYEAACTELAAAEAAGIHSEDDVAEYYRIRESFVSMNSYKDSDVKVTEIDAAVADYEQSLVADAYASASELLDNRAWLSARDAFTALGSYSDSETLAQECLYRRAEALLAFCENYDTRKIEIALSDTVDNPTVISVPGSVLSKLGSDAVLELQSVFEEDGVKVIYDESTDVPLQPICTALSEELARLGDYKNCTELASRAAAAGDYSSEFYALLRSGELQAALDWLNTYDDTIEYRELYQEKIPMYFAFCKTWTLHQGDSSLIAFSAGVEGTTLQEFVPYITIEGTEATIHLAPYDGSYSVALTAQLGEDRFVYSPDGNVYYYALINQVEHFTYLRYLENGTLLSSCEYRIE